MTSHDETLLTLHPHAQRAERYEKEAALAEEASSRLGLARLVVFLVMAALVVSAVSSANGLMGAGAALALALFIGLVIAQARVIDRGARAKAHVAASKRHIARAACDFASLPDPSWAEIPTGHPFAYDLDLVGPHSLLARIDTTHTRRGGERLLGFLLSPAMPAEARARQEAVVELSERIDFRDALEASCAVLETDRIDERPLLSLVAGLEALPTPAKVAAYVVPVLLLSSATLASEGIIDGRIPTLLAVISAGVLIATAARVRRVLDLVAAKRGYVDAITTLLELVATLPAKSPRLAALVAKVHLDGQRPKAYLARLDRYASLAELRYQGPFHIIVDILLLWDLHVVMGLERWRRDVTKGLEGAFEALAEVEALCSLSTLLDVDPGAKMPELLDAPSPLVAERLAHPLLTMHARVANDITIEGPGTAVVVTGSNMAGKSTLLRSLGTATSLALAGGPVIAERFVTGPVRMRASMRVEDSVQRGASYFHAELERLRIVVGEAEASPPILFLLDELLRGTNADARSKGARAIVLHLISRGAMGVVATHDGEVARLEDKLPGRIQNVHFTDIEEDGEMRFDYILRPGVVRSSNALRLLALAGIDLKEDEALPVVRD